MGLGGGGVQVQVWDGIGKSKWQVGTGRRAGKGGTKQGLAFVPTTVFATVVLGAQFKMTLQ